MSDQSPDLAPPAPPIDRQIEELAELQFTDQEIAVIMEMDAEELIDLYGPAVDRGRLRAEAEVRRAIYQLAAKGSTQAQKQFIALNEAAKKKALPRTGGQI
jgi:hypothetical protein